eukprot:scaffold87507_cov28-Tisochrysis_lutea.AAC.2
MTLRHERSKRPQLVILLLQPLLQLELPGICALSVVLSPLVAVGAAIIVVGVENGDGIIVVPIFRALAVPHACCRGGGALLILRFFARRPSPRAAVCPSLFVSRWFVCAMLR